MSQLRDATEKNFSRLEGTLEQLLTPEKTAEILACTVKTVHRLCREGRLSYVRISGRGERRFLPQQIQAFIDAQTIQAPRPVDRRKSRKLPCPPKGGEKELVGVKGSGLRKEIQNLCQ